MTESSIFDVSSGSSLSKSQKKRAKRNNAKAKKGNEKETTAKKDVGTLNPLDKVRATLLQRGFSSQQIDEAFEEMWNAQLIYDDVDSVHTYLILKAAAGRASSETFATSQKDASGSDQILETSLSESVSVEQTESVHNEEVAHDASETVEDESDVSNKNDCSASLSEAQPLENLSSKLDIVANYEILNDAIMALSEWVTKSASLTEIKEFCNPSDSSSFATVVRRCLEDRGEESKGLVVDLVTSILRSSGMPISGALPVAKALWEVLKKAQSSSSAPLADGIMTMLPREIALHLSNTLANMGSSRDETEKMIHRLEIDLADIMSNGHRLQSTSKAGDLMSKRDRCKDVASTFSSIVRLSNTFILGSNRNGTSKPMQIPIAEDNDQAELIISLLGEKYRSARSYRSEMEDLKRRYVESNHTVVSSKRSLLSGIQAQKLRQQAIHDRMNVLNDEIRDLMAEDSILSEAILDGEKNLQILDQSMSVDARKMEADIESMSQLVSLEDNAIDFAKSAMDLRGVFRTVATQSAAADEEKLGVKLEEDVQKAVMRFESYISHVKTYFDAELAMIDFIKGRYMNIEKSLSILEKQIEECSLLGMKTNVAEMTKELKQSMANIVDDKEVTQALMAEAQSMKDQYIHQVEDFSIIANKVGVDPSTWSRLNTLFNEIKTSCLALGFHLDDRTEVLFEACKQRESVLAVEVVPEQKNVVTNGHSHSMKSLATGISSDSSEKSNVITNGHLDGSSISSSTILKQSKIVPPTKRGWGATATQQAKQPALSLIDIQKEQKESA